MKKAFTLVELLIVIAIIAILAGVLFVSMGSGTEKARTAKCMSNLRNLATGCTTYAMREGHYPLSASIEYVTMQKNNNKYEAYYGEKKGWISWQSRGAYTSHGASKAASIEVANLYETDRETQMFSITNGTMYGCIGENLEVYLCPSHVQLARTAGMKPWWSYQMNGYFKGDAAMDSSTVDGSSYAGINYSKLTLADRRLLFTEVPFTDQTTATKDVVALMPDAPYTDTAIQYNDLANYGGTKEDLFFNHHSGKRRCANVAFADGHVEKLMQPKSGDMQELMEWLCKGKDLSFNGDSYDKLDD